MANAVFGTKGESRRFTFTMTANHTSLRFEPHDLFEDQLQDSDTRIPEEKDQKRFTELVMELNTLFQKKENRLADQGPKAN